ncbi:MAG: TetR/AcrR family transcriptional regulator [Thermoleophilaceae bacterium]
MDDIAAAAGVTKPVLYDHFASKLDLYVRLTEGIRDVLTARGAAAMAAGATPEQRVRSGIEAFFDFVQQRPDAARVLLFIPQGEPELVDAAGKVQAGASAAIAAMLGSDPALLAGEPDRERRLDLYSEFTKQGIHALAEWWSQHPETERATLVDAVMDLIWSGLRAGYRSP